MKKGIFRKAVSLLMALVMALACAVTSSAADEKSVKTVTIGYIDYQNFIELGSDGVFKGYAVELLNDISNYTGWKYEFVYGSWSDLMEKVKNGEVDFVCQAQKTDERLENYLFARYSTGSESNVLYVKTDDERYYYDDYENFDGMKVAFMKGSFQNTEFAEYAEQKGFTYTSAYYPTDSDSFAALDRGEVDAVAMGSLAGKSGYKIISRFGSDPFYFMTGLANAELVEEINDALGEILGADPNYVTKLYDKYYVSAGTGKSLDLTREEAEYIAQCGEIKIGQLRRRYPISLYNEETGELAGINEDILQKLSEISGLKFTCDTLYEGEKTTEAIATGRFDLIMGIVDNDKFRQDESLTVTDSYLESTLSVVMKKGGNFDPSQNYNIALKSSFVVLQNYITANYPQFNVQFYATDELCIKAVLDGDADLVMQNVYVSNYLLQKPQYSDLEMLPTTFMTEKSAFLASSSVDKRLISIINKSIKLLRSDDIDRIILANTTAKPYRLTLVDLIYKYKYPIIIVCILVIAVIVLLAANGATKRKNMVVLKEKNSQLSDAVQQAEHANRAKSEFLSRMSHEIRTPMNAIVGITTIAKNYEDSPEKIDDYLSKIDAASKVLLNIINDVLDMSAIESNKLKIGSAEFDIKQVLNGITTIYYSQCKSKGIDFEVNADISNEILIGDSLRVNQILLNLVSNAFKFTEKGGIKVNVSQTGKKNELAYLRFVVQDTGCGMSEEMKARLFKPFEQETADTAKKHGGSGLGLSIAKNLVDMMHGAISVESEKGVGTTFTVDIPFKIAERKELNADEVKDIRAIVVDDDQASREYTSIVLGRIGVDFDVAESGKQALEMMDKAKESGRGYGICFLDWKMPEMSGVEVTREIRNRFNNDTVIIIVSAYDLNEVEDEAKEAGADMFVPKPLFQSTVFNVLMQISGGKYKKDAENTEDFDFTGHKLLLAEDNELNVEVATELLQLVNMECDVASDGGKALEMFKNSEKGTYCCILMDVQMPVMDGYETTREIRALEREDAKTIPIYAMTANAFTEDVSAAISAGMNGHIAKPIDVDVLYETLDKVIKGK